MSNKNKTGFTFEEVCLSFIEKCRFYTVLLSKIPKRPLKVIPTAAVGFDKHGKLNMFYNPDFFKKLPLDEAQGLIEHECGHIVYRHLTRFKMKQTTIEGNITAEKLKGAIKDMHENKIINWGTDAAINQYIKSLPTFKSDDPEVVQGLVQDGQSMGIYPETYDLPRDLAAEFYVAELRKKFPTPEMPDMPKSKGQQKQDSQQGQCSSCDGTGKKDKQQGQDGQDGQGQDQQDQGQQEQNGQGQPQENCPDCNGTGQNQDQGNGLDSHDFWDKVVEVDEEGNIKSLSDVKDHPDIDPEYECEATVMRAVRECKDFGKLPAHIEKEIERLKAKERHNWKRELKIFINSVLSISKRRTQKKVDRRLATLVEYIEPGKKKSRKPKVLYVRDTSGSMFNDKVQAEITAELEQLAKRCDVYVADADTKVHQHYRFKKASDLKPYKGGGGTCFIEAFSVAKKLGVDGIIYATDTYGSFPDAKSIGHFSKDTIWLTFNQEKVDIPYGKHVNINPNDYKDDRLGY